MNLTIDQIERIDRHLRKENWLLNEDLITELTDHYVAGTTDRMAQGTSFETAIQEIHADFGRRKGLLALEEDFQKTQAKRFARLLRQQFVRYFQLSRLPVTGLIFGLVYGLVKLYPTVSKTIVWNSTVVYSMLGCLCLLYIVGYARLIARQNHESSPKSISQFLWPLVQSLNLLFIVGWNVNLFVPIDRLAVNYPLPVTLLVTLVLLFELATSELLFKRLASNRRRKFA